MDYNKEKTSLYSTSSERMVVGSGPFAQITVVYISHWPHMSPVLWTTQQIHQYVSVPIPPFVRAVGRSVVRPSIRCV